ncbi:MAG: ABC transporter permease, partial [Acidobacteriota bacterium]
MTTAEFTKTPTLRRRRRPWVALIQRLFREKPFGALAGGVFLVFLLGGVFAQIIAPHGVNDTDMRHRLEAPSLQFPMGTDHVGRDVFSRILYGAQLSMIV